MMANMWTRMVSLDQQCTSLGLAVEAQQDKTKSSMEKVQRCSHCRNIKLHDALGLAHVRNKCPLTTLAANGARKAAAVALDAFTATPSTPLTEHLATAKAAHSTS